MSIVHDDIVITAEEEEHVIPSAPVFATLYSLLLHLTRLEN